MRNRTRARGAAAILAALILVPALSGCVSATLIDTLTGGQKQPTPEQSAQIQNSKLEQGVDELLDHLWQGEWDLPPGGQYRTACDAGQGEQAYLFYGSWFTPEEMALPGEREVAKSAMSGFRSWLESEGWSDLEEFEFTLDAVDVNAFGVAGSKPEAGIYEMQAIYYFEGDYGIDYPHVVVDVDSECLVVDL